MLFASRKLFQKGPTQPTTKLTAKSLQKGPGSFPRKAAPVPGGPIRVPEEEKQRRKKEGLCFKCGKPGHVTKDY